MHPPPASGGGKWRVAGHTRESCATAAVNAVCTLLLVALLVAGVLLFVAWLGLRPHRPRFTVESFAVVISGDAAAASEFADQVVFNVSVVNPNRHVGIRYGPTRAGVYYVDDLVAGGGRAAISGGWYQPKGTTAFVAGEIGVRIHVDCHVAVGADGELLPEFVGAACDRYF
uniref:Late embryogenesis abundant protein LEA-2 subgroup domain-containing protein n=1 Tax=Leersia perrieri TaxID=77586 RepID=A0A0D9XTN3_9ORYZ